MRKNDQFIGSCKSLTKSIQLMRKILKRRGPWPQISLREYHDFLLWLIAITPKKRLHLCN